MREQQITITFEKKLITVAVELPSDTPDTLLTPDTPVRHDHDEYSDCPREAELETVQADLKNCQAALADATIGMQNARAEASRLVETLNTQIVRKSGLLTHAFGALDMIVQRPVSSSNPRELQEHQTIMQIHSMIAKELNIQL